MRGTQSRFYLFDALGNARSLLDPNGNLLATVAYKAYGTPLGTPLPSTPYGWQGESGCRTDSETDFVYMQARYYSPALGKFVSRDPIGFAGGINLYGYCYGDPVNYWDPNGTDGFIGIPGGTIAGAAGFFGVTIASRNPVLGVIGGAAIGTGWSYYRDHKDLKTSIADGCMGGLIGNGIDDALVAGTAYLDYSSSPSAEAASEPEVAEEDANSKTFCQLKEELQNSQASEVNKGGSLEPKGGTYKLVNTDNRVMYVGRTNNFSRRMLEHSKTYSQLGFMEDWRTDDYNVQRGREQMLYDEFNPPLNRIRPISPNNKSFTEYINAALRFKK